MRRAFPFGVGMKKSLGKVARKAKKKLFRIPYWLHGGDRSCAGCDRGHAHDLEVRCAACDRPFCSFCVTVVEGEPFCSQCDISGGGP